MQFVISETRKSVNTIEHRVYLSTLLVSTLLNMDCISFGNGALLNSLFCISTKTMRNLNPRRQAAANLPLYANIKTYSHNIE